VQTTRCRNYPRIDSSILLFRLLTKSERPIELLICWAFALVVIVTVACTRPTPHPRRALEAIKNDPLLAVSRTDSNRVTLISLGREEREIETIPLPCTGPFGLAFSPKRDWLYAACWSDSQIALIDLQIDTEPRLFTGARLPAWMRLRDGSHEIWVSNEGAGKVSIYRSGESEVLGEISTGAGPSDIVFTNKGSRAWVSNETAGTVSLLDAEQRHKIRDISVGRVPQGMALTGHKDQLLVANFGSNTVSVIDTVNAREVGRIAVCQGPIDVATSFQHGLGQDGPELGYVSCFTDGSVAILDINR